MKVRLFPLWKPLLKILAARWFLLSWAFAFKKHERSEFIVAFGVSGACPWTRSRREFITVVKKYPLCILAYYFFKSIVSTLFPLILIFLIAQLSLVKNCPWRNEVKSKKSLSFSEKTKGNFSWKILIFSFLIILIILIILRPMKATASKAYRGHILTDWLLHTDRLTTSYWQIDYFILTDWLLHTDMIFSCQHNTWKGLSAWQIIWL